MLHKQVTFSLPSDVLQAFKEPVGSLEKKFRLYLAIMLYREAELSLERSAKMAGLCIEDFLYELGKHNVSVFNYPAEQLKKELESI
ncbi:Uncharacterised protein [uncultured archaeon]|nr:Uncharacterised protein [uncultured archaeon]